MLARLSEDSLGLEGEISFLVLQVGERRYGGEAVIDLHGNAIKRSQMTGTDTQHVCSGAEDPSFIVYRKTQIGFRSLAIEHILCRLQISWTDGEILHLP